VLFDYLQALPWAELAAEDPRLVTRARWPARFRHPHLTLEPGPPEQQQGTRDHLEEEHGHVAPDRNHRRVLGAGHDEDRQDERGQDDVREHAPGRQAALGVSRPVWTVTASSPTTGITSETTRRSTPACSVASRPAAGHGSRPPPARR
jgi:hypothetical protein